MIHRLFHFLAQFCAVLLLMTAGAMLLAAIVAGEKWLGWGALPIASIGWCVWLALLDMPEQEIDRLWDSHGVRVEKLSRERNAARAELASIETKYNILRRQHDLARRHN
jgi:hypothetical protein